jgi:hypothetical protein
MRHDVVGGELRFTVHSVLISKQETAPLTIVGLWKFEILNWLILNPLRAVCRKLLTSSVLEGFDSYNFAYILMDRCHDHAGKRSRAGEELQEIVFAWPAYEGLPAAWDAAKVLTAAPKVHPVSRIRTQHASPGPASSIPFGRGKPTPVTVTRSRRSLGMHYGTLLH